MALLSIKDFAKRIGMSHFTIREWVRDGKLQALRVGGRAIRIPESELDKIKSRYEINEGKIIEPDYTKLPENDTENKDLGVKIV